MQICDLLLLVSFAILSLVNCQAENEEGNERAERLAEMMKHDGVERVVELSQKNVKRLLKKYNIVIVMYHTATNDTVLRQEKHALEIVAKLFQNKGVICASCDMLKNIGFVKETGVLYPGSIVIFNRGKLVPYHGQRSPDIMVPYVSRLFEPPVNDIVSKTAKKFFDAVQLPKVIAYVERDSQEYAELQQSARSFQPMIQFHAVFDAKIAKSLQLKKLNSLLFVKQFEKAVKSPNNFQWKEKHISEFINKNRRQLIKKMLLENIHEIWSPEMKGFLVAIFAKIENTDGNRFFSLVKSLARGYADSEKLNFVWIDPDPFPAMREYWQSTFNVDPTKPSIGAVNLNEQSSAWLVQPEGRSLQLSDLKKWTSDLLSGKLKLVPMKKMARATDGAPERERTMGGGGEAAADSELNEQEQGYGEAKSEL